MNLVHTSFFLAAALTTHIDDVLGCREPAILLRVRKYLERRYWGVKVQKQSFVRVAMELSQVNDFSIQLAQENFTNAPKPMPTVPEVWASRQRPLSIREIRM